MLGQSELQLLMMLQSKEGYPSCRQVQQALPAAPDGTTIMLPCELMRGKDVATAIVQTCDPVTETANWQLAWNDQTQQVSTSCPRLPKAAQGWCSMLACKKQRGQL
jgi:hypothetical protein